MIVDSLNSSTQDSNKPSRSYNNLSRAYKDNTVYCLAYAYDDECGKAGCGAVEIIDIAGVYTNFETAKNDIEKWSVHPTLLDTKIFVVSLKYLGCYDRE